MNSSDKLYLDEIIKASKVRPKDDQPSMYTAVQIVRNGDYIQREDVLIRLYDYLWFNDYEVNK